MINEKSENKYEKIGNFIINENNSKCHPHKKHFKKLYRKNRNDM